MAERQSVRERRRWVAQAIFAAACITLIVPAAGTAERVVLGEYFTNFY